MKLRERHILFIGRILVLLFFLANSGFTVIFHRCTMEDVSCCGGSDDNRSGNCGMMDLPQAFGGPSVTAGGNCISVIIAGGLKADPTVVEKEFTAGLAKADLVVASTQDFGSSTISPQFQLLSSTATRDVSPPSVAKYVFNSSFLI